MLFRITTDPFEEKEDVYYQFSPRAEHNRLHKPATTLKADEYSVARSKIDDVIDGHLDRDEVEFVRVLEFDPVVPDRVCLMVMTRKVDRPLKNAIGHGFTGNRAVDEIEEIAAVNGWSIGQTEGDYYIRLDKGATGVQVDTRFGRFMVFENSVPMASHYGNDPCWMEQRPGMYDEILNIVYVSDPE